MISTIAKRLTDWRKKLGISRIKVAKMLELSYSTYAAWEKGERIPNPVTVQWLEEKMK